jgi:hypothetical protein
MKRALFAVALVGSALAVALLPGSVAADISPTQTTQVILSCADGHSVILWADAATLSSLATDVQALNALGSGCTMSTSAADPSSAAAKWTVYDYNPSGQAIAPRNSPNSLPATTSGSTTTFDFLRDHFTALLTTTDKSLTGDLSTATLSDQISVGGPALGFVTQHNETCTSNTPATVRFYFVSPRASGSSVGTPPAGFYTRFWWSNPVNLPLPAIGGSGGGTITADMSDPAEWSDWNGQSGANPAVTAAFIEATHNVQEIGLSFGGTCFFETGAQAVYGSGNPPPYEQLSSTFTES